MINTDKIFRFYDSFFQSDSSITGLKKDFYTGGFNHPSLKDAVKIEINADEEFIILSHYLREEYDEETGAFIGEDEENKKFYFVNYLTSKVNSEANTLYRGIKSKLDEFLQSKDGIENYQKLVLNKLGLYLIKCELEPYKKYPILKEAIKNLNSHVIAIFEPFTQQNDSVIALKPMQRVELNITVAEFAYLFKLLQESKIIKIEEGNALPFFRNIASLFRTKKTTNINPENLANQFKELKFADEKKVYETWDTKLIHLRQIHNDFKDK